MRCPFLEEAEGRFCEIAPFRKMIPISSDPAGKEICSTREHLTCPWAKERLPEGHDAEQCPFLRRTLVQFCSAAAERRFIPYSERLLTCCGTDSHLYCDLFLSLAKPDEEGAAPPGGSPEGGAGGAKASGRLSDAIEVPPHLAFTANHMWLDLRLDATWHLGVDAFFARVIGEVEDIWQVTPKESGHSSAVVRAHGVNLPVGFPKFLPIRRFNVGLRTDPGRMVSDPYGRGWLFEGTIPFDPAGSFRKVLMAGLFLGEQTLGWMKSEMDRMTAYVHDFLLHAGPGRERLLADGGIFCEGLAGRLTPGDLLQLHDRFFSPARVERAS